MDLFLFELYISFRKTLNHDLKTASDGESAINPGKPFQWLTTLTVENLRLISTLYLFCFDL